MSLKKESRMVLFKDKNKLEKLARLVEAKSKVVNITAIKDFDSIWKKHILDSLEIANSEAWEGVLTAGEKVAVADLGTGGGFPGLPLAINYPQINFTLIDGTRKKIDVVDEFARSLDLKNVKAVWGRSEDLIKTPQYKGKFDFVVSRAVAYLPDLIELSLGLLKTRGIMAFYKTFNEQEVKEGELKVKELGLKLREIYKYKLESDETERCIVFIGK